MGRRGLLGVRAGLRGLFVRPWHDAVAIGGIGRQHAVITDKVEANSSKKNPAAVLGSRALRYRRVTGPLGGFPLLHYDIEFLLGKPCEKLLEFFVDESIVEVYCSLAFLRGPCGPDQHRVLGSLIDRL